jgi:hypothetical protein
MNVNYTYIKYILTIAIFLIFIIPSHAQKWTYKLSGNEFDGQYKTAKVIGSGGNFPYQSPSLVINYFVRDNNLNIYLANAGYAGCDEKSMVVKFNNDEKLYAMNASTNSDNDLWFIDDNYYSDLTNINLLQKLKEHSFVFFRIKSKCGQTDYKFSLSGSTKAINYVAANYIQVLGERNRVEEERVNRYIREEEAREAAEEKLKTHIANGGKVKCVSFYDALVYDKPDISEVGIGNLIKGDSIIVSKYGSKLGFYNLHSSANFIESKGKSLYYYVTLKAVIDDTCEIVEDK